MDGGMVGQVRPPQSRFKAQAQKAAEIGIRIPFNDGRIYVYTKCGGDTDLVMGQLQQAPAVDESNVVNLAIPTAGVTDDKELEVTIPTGHASFAANAYEGGWLLIDSAAAEGLVRRIKAHDAFTTGTAATVTFKFRDKLDEAVADTNTVKLIANPFNGIIVNASVTGGASNTGRTLGVAPIDVTKAYYCWVLVNGIGPAINKDSEIHVGIALCAAGTDVDVMTAYTDALIGNAASYCAASDESLLVDYKLG